MADPSIPTSSSSSDLSRLIGFWSGVGVVVGTTIGSGIFRVPGELANRLGHPLIILALWGGFGLVSLCGALAMAELGCLLPQTGGIYVYLRAAYGDAAAFVFGWLYLLVTVPSAIGALAVFFAELVREFIGLDPVWELLIAIATILFLMAANIRGLKQGLLIQDIFTLIKVGALLLLIVTALIFGHGDFGHLLAPAQESLSLGSLAAAVYLIMWSNSGWQSLSMVAGEIKDPQRLMTPILVTGLLTVAVLYCGANVAYEYVLPIEAIGAEPIAALRVMTLVLGDAGKIVLQLCIMASVFGALNGVVLTRTRVPFALARDGLTFSVLGKCHERWATPYVAIIVQGSVAIGLVLSLRQFTALTRYFAVVEYLALVFAVMGVFILRRTMALAQRPYRTFGYPVVPWIFIVGAGVGVLATLISAVNEGAWAPLIGLGITLLGFPMYWFWRRRKAGPRIGSFIEYEEKPKKG
jgi:amino acid transporter